MLATVAERHATARSTSKSSSCFDLSFTVVDSAPSDMARSLSMPAFGQAANQPRRRPVARKNSWLSFQDAFQVAPQEAESAPIIEEGDEENDDAAMFF